METTHIRETRGASNYLKRLSWGAVFAGVVVAIIVQLLFSLLGVGIGFVSFTPTTDGQPFSGFGTGAMIWWIITILISLFAGGWVSGWLATTNHKVDRMIHGVLTWSIFSLFSLYVVTTSVGAVVGGIGSVIGKGLSAAGSAIKEGAPQLSGLIGDNLGIDNEDLKKLKDEAKLMLRQTGKSELQPENLENKAKDLKDDAEGAAKTAAQNPQKADDKADDLLSKLYNMGEDTFSEMDKEALVNVVSARTNKSKSEATEIVNNWIATAQDVKESVKEAAQEAKETAKEVSEEVTDAIGRFAIFSFFALLVGAGAAVFGANMGRDKTQHTHITTVS